jgi:hypothetical protein
MSKSIVSLQVPPQPAAPPGAAAIGLGAAVVCIALRDIARAISAVLAHPQERRHA